ncbi:hypothetical protein J7M28_12195 [bacterium]|nr:hypothetical protein [bacterium]
MQAREYVCIIAIAILVICSAVVIWSRIADQPSQSEVPQQAEEDPMEPWFSKIRRGETLSPEDEAQRRKWWNDPERQKEVRRAEYESRERERRQSHLRNLQSKPQPDPPGKQFLEAITKNVCTSKAFIVLEIALTIIVVCRGWKGWVAVPWAVTFLVAGIGAGEIAKSDNIPEMMTHFSLLLLLDPLLIGTLILMAILGKRSNEEKEPSE